MANAYLWDVSIGCDRLVTWQRQGEYLVPSIFNFEQVVPPRYGLAVLGVPYPKMFQLLLIYYLNPASDVCDALGRVFLGAVLVKVFGGD